MGLGLKKSGSSTSFEFFMQTGTSKQMNMVEFWVQIGTLLNK